MTVKSTTSRVLSEGFRPFFLAAGLYGVFTGLVWLIWLAVHAAGGMMELTSQAVAPHQWHAHEMVFGYAGAAIGGFFLTAVPNWTNTPGARSLFIALVTGLWLAGRLAVWNSAHLPAWGVAVIDLAFVPVLATKILSQLLKRPKPQNMVFLSFLIALWTANLMVHLDWMGLTGTLDAGIRMGILTLCGLIAVLGGRITPAFTRNAMKRAGVDEAGWPVSVPMLDRATMVLALALPWTMAVSATLAAPVAFLLGLAQAARMARWRAAWTLRQPILWSLHLGLGLLALGLILWALSEWGLGSEVAALHMLGIGCVGTMTLAVMSRAALGHTGRALVAPGPVAAAYVLMALAALTRWAGSSLPIEWYWPAMLGTAALWVAAFTLFLVSIWPVLIGPHATRAG